LRFLQPAGKGTALYISPFSTSCSLGGVHRGGQDCEIEFITKSSPCTHFSLQAMDVSADLHELSRCPVGLVSAGVKSILDIGRLAIVFQHLNVLNFFPQDSGVSGKSFCVSPDVFA